MTSAVIERSITITSEEDDPFWFPTPKAPECRCYCGGCLQGSLHCGIADCELETVSRVSSLLSMDEEEDDCTCLEDPSTCSHHKRSLRKTMTARDNPGCTCDDATRPCLVHDAGHGW